MRQFRRPFAASGRNITVKLLLIIVFISVASGGCAPLKKSPGTSFSVDTFVEKGDVEGYVYVEDAAPSGKVLRNSKIEWRRLAILQKQPPIPGYTVVSGAVIEYKDDPTLSTFTDSNGYFKLKNVPQITNPEAASIPEIIASPPSGDPNFQNVLPAIVAVASNPASEKEIVSLKVVPQRAAVSSNETHQFIPLGKTVSGKVIVRTGVTWSVIGNIGTIDSAGLFKSADVEGTGEVAATLGSFQATAEVRVNKSSADLGTISGKVTYTDGSPITGAYVIADGANRVVKTGSDGGFDLPLIPEGTWTVLAIFGGKTVAQGIVQVTGGQTATLNLTVAVSSPLPYIESISPSSGAPGQTITISGKSFVSSQGSGSITFSGVLASVSSWGDASIVCTVPTGAVSGNVVVTVNGLMSNPFPFAVIPPPPPPPQIASISPSSGQAGASVTIAGSHFGASQGQSTVEFSGVKATVTSWSDNQVVCVAPNGATTGTVLVTVGSQASNAMNFTVTPPRPVISSITPSDGPVSSAVTISGSNFGQSQGQSTVVFNGIPAAVSSWSDASIVCSVPSGASAGNVVVTVQGQGSNSIYFSVWGKLIFSMNRFSDSISVVDTMTQAVVRTIPAGASQPIKGAVSPDGKLLCVSNQNSSSVSLIDTTTCQVVKTIPVGQGPLGLTFTPDGSKVYVANYFGDDLSVINTATQLVTSSITLGGNWPRAIAIAPNFGGLFGYVPRGAVEKVNLATGIVERQINTGTMPIGIAIHPAGTYAYVGNEGEGANPAVNPNTVAVVNLATDAIETIIPVGLRPYGVAISPDGKLAATANSGDNTVSVIDTMTRAVVQTIAVSGSPLDVAFTVDNRYLYSLDTGANKISIIDRNGYAIVKSITVGAFPYGIAVQP